MAKPGMNVPPVEPDVDDEELGVDEDEIVPPIVPIVSSGVPAPDVDMAEPTEDVNRYRMPDHRNREMFAIADELLGASKIKAMCEDGKSRMARIPGKMKRRMWIKPGDLIIVKPWDFQDDKADVKYRYVRTQAVNLSRKKKIPELLDAGF